MVVSCLALAATTSPAAADAWFPDPAGGQWTYQWRDTTYNPSGTTEAVTVPAPAATTTCGWQVAWTGDTQIPIGIGGSGPQPVIDSPDNGTMCFLDQEYGLENTDWSSTPPLFTEPSLCASSAQCANSLSSTMYDVIWGSRNPLISEPLLQGTTWTATGGGDGSVTSSNKYLGLQTVRVPAFPGGVRAAAIQSQISLAGTPGDDYGSGTRTTWWVYGVGPVKLEFDHVDGSITTSQLQSTNLKPGVSPPDADYFPLTTGVKNRYRWTNSRYMRKPEIQAITVPQALNRSARITVKSVSGPIRAAANYVFAMRLNGLRNTYTSGSAATLLKFPKLGHGRHFITPIDLMTYGFSPVLPAYPTTGLTWKSGNAYDMKVFGVKGVSRILGVRRVHVPAGTFQALEVRSWLTQAGHRYGSGVRTMWFANGRGLVKLVFKHRDGSTSLVQLIK